MIDYYVCYNQISYLVACEEVRRLGHRASVILCAGDRVRRQRRYRLGWCWPLNRASVLLALLAAMLRRPRTVAIPHHAGGRLIRWLAARATRVCLLDDGLDTLRDRPRNVDPAQLDRVAALLTFSDYRALGRWTERLPVQRVAALELLLADERPPLPTSAHDVLVVESPGVAVERIEQALERPAARMLHVRHSNPDKAGALPADWPQVAATGASLEKTVIGFGGTVIVGETMVMALCVHQLRPPGPRLVVQLGAEQYRNLRPLHAAIRDAGARLFIDGVEQVHAA